MPRMFIGLMSGTSLDGIDAVLADLSGPRPAVHAALTHPMPADLRADILALCQPGDNEIDRLGELDNRVGEAFAAAVHALLIDAGIEAENIEAIGSHGQTVRHRPEVQRPFTLQIGNPALICELTGITTVADFRRADMAAGGQGAPLVPAFHEAVFRSPDGDRVVLNIGGMANITLLPHDLSQPVTGFDTGPGNVLLDAWAERHLDEPVDRDGAWASGGHVDAGLLKHLLSDDYFAAPPPKSTGRERFNLAWLEGRLANRAGATAPQDVQATVSELVATSIAEAMDRYAPQALEVLVCGGGVHNLDLMSRLQAHLPGRQVRSTTEHGIHPDQVEGLTFAWLAKRALDGEPGNIPSVTGARHPAILGAVYRV